jgi:hypothetical protein
VRTPAAISVTPFPRRWTALIHLAQPAEVPIANEIWLIALDGEALVGRPLAITIWCLLAGRAVREDNLDVFPSSTVAHGESRCSRV